MSRLLRGNAEDSPDTAKHHQRSSSDRIAVNTGQHDGVLGAAVEQGADAFLPCRETGNVLGRRICCHLVVIDLGRYPQLLSALDDQQAPAYPRGEVPDRPQDQLLRDEPCAGHPVDKKLDLVG